MPVRLRLWVQNPRQTVGDLLFKEMSVVYILYSCSIDSYYIGVTSDIEKRLKEHKEGFYEQSYTRQATDWELYYELPCEHLGQSLKIEKHIKSMKSRKYIENLKKYEEIGFRLLRRYR